MNPHASLSSDTSDHDYIVHLLLKTFVILILLFSASHIVNTQHTMRKEDTQVFLEDFGLGKHQPIHLCIIHEVLNDPIHIVFIVLIILIATFFFHTPSNPSMSSSPTQLPGPPQTRSASSPWPTRPHGALPT